MDEYSLIATLPLSANLPTNLSFIGHVLKKQRRPQKETGLAIAILDSDIKHIVKPSKRTCLFLKPLKPPPNTDKVPINITGVSSKIIE